MQPGDHAPAARVLRGRCYVSTPYPTEGQLIREPNPRVREPVLELDGCRRGEYPVQPLVEDRWSPEPGLVTRAAYFRGFSTDLGAQPRVVFFTGTYRSASRVLGSGRRDLVVIDSLMNWPLRVKVAP